MSNETDYLIEEKKVLDEFGCDLRTLQRWKNPKHGYKKFILPCKTYNEGFHGKNGNFYREIDLQQLRDLRSVEKINVQMMPTENLSSNSTSTSIAKKSNLDMMTAFVEALKPKESLSDLSEKWFLTPSEASRLSGLPKKMILDAVNADKLKFIKQGSKKPVLIKQDSLLDWKKTL